MKLNCAVPVFHIWKDKVKAHPVLHLTVHTLLFWPCIEMYFGSVFPIFNSAAFFLCFMTIFSLHSILFLLTLVCFPPITNYFRNPNLNASACGFLQKLSLCLLSQSDPAFGTYQHGMQMHARTCTTRRASCSTSKNPVVSVSCQAMMSCC